MGFKANISRILFESLEMDPKFCVFLWILIFLGKRELTNFQQPGRTVLFVVFGLPDCKREKGLGQVVSDRKSKGGLIKRATIDERRGLLVNHNLRRIGLSFFLFFG